MAYAIFSHPPRLCHCDPQPPPPFLSLPLLSLPLLSFPLLSLPLLFASFFPRPGGVSAWDSKHPLCIIPHKCMSKTETRDLVMEQV